MIEIEYTLTESDFAAATVFATHGRSVGRRIRLWVMRVIGLAFAVSGGLLLSRPESRLGGSYVFLTGVAFCCASPLTRFWARRRFSKMTQLHGLYRVTFTDEAMHCVAPAGDTTMAWRVWGTWAEDSKNLVLGQRGSTMFMPIPKGALDESKIDELRSFLSSHIASK